MITQILALLLDGYRELNARKLFWITLVLTAAFIGGFALFGADERGFKVLGWHWDMPMATYLYRSIFSYVIVGFWLTFVAAILALVSTAGIFPDLITGGTIDLYLSKPLSRLRLFFIKYLTGLLFVTLQIAVVVIGGFLILGFRASEWKPGLFWSIPIVLCFFSYLFSICVLLGLTTRSTIAAILLTIVFWGAFWAIGYVEWAFFKSQVTRQVMIEQFERRVSREDAALAATRPTTEPGSEDAYARVKARHEADLFKLNQARDSDHWLPTAHRVLYVLKTIVPKTTETTDLMDRILFTDEEIAAAKKRKYSMFIPPTTDEDMESQFQAAEEGETRAEIAARDRSPAWIVGTSLAFEAVVLALAAWVFCRRDY